MCIRDSFIPEYFNIFTLSGFYFNMLQRLSIRNYALIEELDITFSKGMTTITGETGAGKSILLGALALLILSLIHI